MTGKSDRVLRLVQDPDIKEAFQSVREYWRDKIEETPLDNPEVLFDIRKMLHLLRDVEDALQTVIDDGHLKDYRIAEKERETL